MFGLKACDDCVADPVATNATDGSMDYGCACRNQGTCFGAGSPYMFDSAEGALQDNGCPENIYRTADYALSGKDAGRCAPSGLNKTAAAAQEFTTTFYNAMNSVVPIQSSIESLWSQRAIVAGLVGLAAAAAFLMVAFMRCCAKPIVYLTIIVGFVGLYGLSGYLSYLSANKGTVTSSSLPSSPPSPPPPPSAMLVSKQRSVLIISITCASTSTIACNSFFCENGEIVDDEALLFLC